MPTVRLPTTVSLHRGADDTQRRCFQTSGRRRPWNTAVMITTSGTHDRRPSRRGRPGVGTAGCRDGLRGKRVVPRRCLDDGAQLEGKPDMRSWIKRVLTVPTCCLVHVALRRSADLVLQADRRRGLCFASRRAITTSPSSSVPGLSVRCKIGHLNPINPLLGVFQRFQQLGYIDLDVTLYVTPSNPSAKPGPARIVKRVLDSNPRSGRYQRRHGRRPPSFVGYHSLAPEFGRR
jgi:hypothetical protein